MVRKIRGTKRKVIVVLDGSKASDEENNDNSDDRSNNNSSNRGVAPLSLAMHHVVSPERYQVLVLVLLHWNTYSAPKTLPTTDTGPSSPSNEIELGVDDHTCETIVNPDFKFLYQEISQRKETYAKVFKPFYLTCETYGVTFEVKIAAGFRPMDIVLEEANRIKANWIVMDRCFARDPSFQISGTKCSNIISVNDDGEAIHHKSPSSSIILLSSSSSTAVNINRSSSSKPNPKLKEPMISIKPNQLGKALSCCPLSDISEISSASSSSSHLATISINQKLKMVAEQPKDHGICSTSTATSVASSSSTHPQLNNTPPFGVSARNFCDPNFVLGLPLKLSMEVIEEITLGFSQSISSDESQQFVVYEGFFAVNQSRVLVKMFKGGSGGVFLEAEKKAAMSMRHKNILRLIGYHQSHNTTFLVLPFAQRGTLGTILHGLGGEEYSLTFQNKLNIAIGIAQGLRYMHEDCPRGPIVHGKVLLGNVYIGEDLQPQISGFGRATWLHLKQSCPSLFVERCLLLEDHLNHDLMAQVKLDVQSFGVLLLRLFCRRSVPQDDDTLIKWARPLLLERAFHVLLEDEEKREEDFDMHEMFRVMCTAFQCAMTLPDNRPYMSEVIAYLKGERFCVMESSPQ